MKKYKVTFREWMYQEKEIIVFATSKKEAIDLAHEELYCPKVEIDDRLINARADWHSYEFKALKPKVRISKTYNMVDSD